MKSALAGPTRRASRSDTILLRIACQHGDLVKLRELLKRGVPVDTLLDDGATPLLVATQRGRDDIVAELLGWRADTFFRRETDLVTPLIAAFNNANANVVALILDHRAKLQPNVQVEVGLYFVEKEETTTVIAEVIDRCARDKDDNRRATPLCIALAKDHLQVLNVLLDRQNAVQWAPLASEVALFIAAQAGHTECVVKLLQCGTRTTLRSEAGVTPLLAALIHGNADIVAVLLDRQGSRGDGGDDSWVLEIELFFQTFGMPAQIVAKICERGEHLGKEVCPELEVPLGEAHLDALEVLLDQEVSVQWSESSRDVGLFFASQFGNEGLVHKLIDQGATLRTKDTGDAVNPFVVACAKGHEDVVAAFLSRGLVTTQAALEWPLCVAAGNGHVEIVRMLLDRGADSSAKSDNDMTPLKASSMNDHIDVVTLLLDRGAVVDWQGESWESILYIAAQAGHTRVVAEFLDRGGPVDFQGDSDATLLHTAALSGRCEIVSLLLERGAFVDFADVSRGVTALMIAAQNGHEDIVATLLSFRAKVDLLEKENGVNALLMAAQNGHTNIVRILLDHGADAKMKRKDGVTALVLAASHGDVEIVNLLLDKSDQTNWRDESPEIALFYAAHAGHTSVVNALLTRGVNISLMKSQGMTPLLAAAQQGHASIVAILLDKGVDFSKSMREEALLAATHNGHIEVVAQLVDRGVDLNYANEKGETALQIAEARGFSDIATIIRHCGALIVEHSG